MAFVQMIPEDQAQGELKELYNAYRAPWGGVDHILKIHSLLPHTLPTHYGLYKSIMFARGPLTRRQREMIALVVSKTNHCSYCVHHHGDALLRVCKDHQLADAIKSDYKRARISPEELAMLQFAEQLTVDPSRDFSLVIRRLSKNGFTNEAILHITLVASYFNFVNRIATGLGVELESYWNHNGYSDSAKPMAHDDRE